METLPDELLLRVYLALADDRSAAAAFAATCSRVRNAVAGDLWTFRRFAQAQAHEAATIRAAARKLLQRPALDAGHRARVRILADLLSTYELPRLLRLLLRSGHLHAPALCPALPERDVPSDAVRLLVEILDGRVASGGGVNDDGLAIVNEALEDAAACGCLPAVAAILNRFTATTAAPWLDLPAAVAGAAGRGHTAVLRLLLAHGAEPTVTALLAAAENGHADSVRILLDRGVAVGAMSEAALRLAAAEGHAAVVDVLLSAGADARVMSSAPLREAARNGHVDVMRILLRAGARADARNSEALRWAAAGGHVSAVVLLLAQAPSRDALIDAVRASAAVGYRSVVRALVAHGVRASEFPEIATLLLSETPSAHATAGLGRAGDFGWAAEWPADDRLLSAAEAGHASATIARHV